MPPSQQRNPSHVDRSAYRPPCRHPVDDAAGFVIRQQRWPVRRRRRTLLPELRMQQLNRWGIAAALASCAVLLVVAQSHVRPFEAWVGSLVVGSAQVDAARALGSVILFRAQGVLVGVEISASCSVALLISPFCLLAGGLIVSRRVSIRRGLTSLGLLVLWLFAVNQARILVIVLSMRIWGLERGYELSHVLLGTVVSTLGVVGGLVIFVRSLTQARSPVELGV